MQGLHFDQLAVESVLKPKSMDAALSIPDLRPLSFSELLDRTFTYYRRHFWMFLSVMAVPQIFIVAMNMCMDAIQRLSLGVTSPGATDPARMMAAGAMGGFLIGMMVMVLLYWVLYSVALGATTFAVSEVHLGRVPTARESYRRMKGRIRRIVDLLFTVGFRIMGVFIVVFAAAGVLAVAVPFASGGNPALAIIAGVLMVFAIIAAIILSLWMMLRYGFAIPALLLEKLTVKEAIRRSVFLTKGVRGRVFLVVVLMSLVAMTVGGLVQSPFYIGVFVYTMKGQPVPPLWLSLPMTLVGGLSYAVTGPLVMIGLALLYYDARVRKEGFDLQVIMDALDARETKPSEAQTASTPELEESSVVLTILLSIVTLYLYYPFWFILRRKALNSLRSAEKIGLVGPLIGFVLLLLGWCLEIVVPLVAPRVEGPGAWRTASDAASVSGFINLAFGILMLLLSFKVRRILLDHSASQRQGMFASNVIMEQQSSFSSVATFFFGIFYLQYKINRLVEEWRQQARSASTADVRLS